MSPKVPIRADHRFIKKLLAATLEGKVEHIPEEFDMLSRVFQKAGGSWERLFGGSPEDVDTLKRVIKAAFKKKMLTPKADWSA